LEEERTKKKEFQKGKLLKLFFYSL